MSDLKVNPATLEFVKKQNATQGKRRAMITVVSLLLIAGIAAAGYWGWSKHKTAQQLAAAKAAVSDARGPGSFDKIRDKVDKGEFTRDQAREAFQAAREAEWQKSMDGYFKTPAADRNKYLDGLIDEQQKRMAEWQKNRPTTMPTTRSDRGGPTSRPAQTDAERAARGQQRADNQSPLQRAQQSEFMAAMRARMAARGIQGPGGGGGRGPGGGGFGGGGGGGGRGGR